MEDQWPIDDEMMVFDGVLMYGDGFVWVWDGIFRDLCVPVNHPFTRRTVDTTDTKIIES